MLMMIIRIAVSHGFVHHLAPRKKKLERRAKYEHGL